MRKRTIVSITPVSIMADSRTSKIAASFGGFGYRSVVVEGVCSALNDKELPFEVISLGRGSTTGQSLGFNSGGLEKIRQLLRTLGDRYASTPMGFLLFALWWLSNELTYLIRPSLKIPRADLYYVHCYEYFPNAWLLAKMSGAAIFYDSHDFYSEISAQEEITPFQRRWVVPFVRRSERRCFTRADCTVTVCEGLAALFEAKFRRRPYVLRNVHDKRLDRPPAKRIRDVLNLPSDVFLSLTIGNAKKGQAIGSVVEAAKKLPKNVHFAFLGKGYQSRLEKVGLTELQERFHFLEPVAPFEVVPFAAGADAALILYYPRSVNYHFALPNGFFQGMAAGLPTLYPDLPEIRRLAERYELGLMIDAKNPDSISRAILRLYNESGLYTKLAKNAEKAAVELSWENEEILLRSLIQGRLRPCDSSII